MPGGTFLRNLAVLLSAIPLHAAAGSQTGPAAALGGSVAIVSDYVDRGVSQSDSHGAVQGELRWRHPGGFFAGVWASTVDFDDGGGAAAEVNYRMGVERDVSRARVTIGGQYVDFPGARPGDRYDLFELNGAMEVAVGPVAVSGELVYTPQNAGRSGDAVYAMLGVRRELTEAWSLQAHVGRQWNEVEAIAGEDYADWGLSLLVSRRRLTATLGFTDTDAHSQCARLCDARVAMGLRLEF